MNINTWMFQVDAPTKKNQQDFRLNIPQSKLQLLTIHRPNSLLPGVVSEPCRPFGSPAVQQWLVQVQSQFPSDHYQKPITAISSGTLTPTLFKYFIAPIATSSPTARIASGLLVKPIKCFAPFIPSSRRNPPSTNNSLQNRQLLLNMACLYPSNRS